MTPDQLANSINGVLRVAGIAILGVFGNFLIARTGGSVLGIMVPTRAIHLLLGPLLILLTSALVVLLFALASAELTSEQIREIQGRQVWAVLGPFFNPFFVGEGGFWSKIGYGFLIVLWWLGMHSFVYSIESGEPSHLLVGWQVLFSVVFLAVGLASMLGIQSCWSKWGFAAYQSKWFWSFVAIPAGAFLPPILLRLGIPDLWKLIPHGN